MSWLLIDVKLFPTGYWDKWPPTEKLEQHYSIIFQGDAVARAAEWCQMDIARFITAAIEERLAEVQAARGEAT